MFRSKGWVFALSLAVPLTAATLAVLFLAFDLLHQISTGADLAEFRQNSKSVVAAVDAVKRQVESTVLDNSLWEEAAKQTSKDIDQEWFSSTWGVPTETGSVYDSVLVVERESENALAAYMSGTSKKIALKEYFGESYFYMISRFPQKVSRHGSAVTLDLTSQGLAVVAAAPIMASSENLDWSKGNQRFLVMVRYLSPELVQTIGSGHVIRSLELHPAAAGKGMLDVTDIKGHVIATASWQNERPGEVALAAVRVRATSALGLLVVVMAGVGIMCWRLIRVLQEREQAARSAALCDPLTGLPNRTALMEEIQQSNVEHRGNIALLYADLDGFKEVNDRYDHHVGDDLIRGVAARMSGIIGPQVFLARVGGDEFVAVFDGLLAEKEAMNFAERLIAHLKPPFNLDGRRAVVGASIGVASAPAGSLPAPELLRRADVAMYEAKAGGRNRSFLYASTLDEERHANLAIAAEMRAAIADQTIDVAYQPVVRASDLEIVAVEALARWPQNSYVRHAPDKFIAIAEENGLIDDLGALVLAKACAAVAKFEKLRVAVNISPVQMRSPQFVKRSLEVVRASGIDPSRVEFEVTEGVLLDNIERTKLQFAELREAGITIALDDFGAGYSSIGYLKTIHFDRIKIDRSIVSNVLHDMRQQSIIQGTVIMAHGMGAAVLAEGVESSEEVLLLRLAGCEELQGYLFHRPMAVEEMTALLQGKDYSAAMRGRPAKASRKAASS